MNTRLRQIIVLGTFGLWMVACCMLFPAQAVGQEAGSTLVLATFDECMRPTAYVQDWGAYEEKASAEVDCVTLNASGTEQAIKMTYDVLRSGSFCGFWLKWKVPEFNPTQWDHLSFRIRGDTAGATRKVKVELKIKESSWGWKIYYVKDITTDWQTISIPLNDFIDPPWGKAGHYDESDEFVITFENIRVTKRAGTVYIDDITFISGRRSSTAPTGAFTFSPTRPSILDSVIFADQSTDSDGTVISWQWNFGDGKRSAVQNPSHRYSAKGIFTVTLTVTDTSDLTDTATQEITVVNVLPEASFTLSPSRSLINRGVTFDASKSSDADGHITEYEWDFGDGATGEGESATHAFSAEGTYTIKLTVTDNDGESAFIEKEAKVFKSGGSGGPA